MKKFCKKSAKSRSQIAAAKGGIKKWLAEQPGVCVKTNFITRAVKLGDLDLSNLGL